jgi:hypothetical protein
MPSRKTTLTGPQQETKSDWGEWEAADLGETVGDVDGARAQLVTQHAHHIPRCNLVRQVLFTQQEKAIFLH